MSGTTDPAASRSPSGGPLTWVFVGPTLSADEVRSVLPDARVLPPIAAGDLWALPIDPGDTVAIIDGFFLQRRSIRHKELIDLLRQSVRVVGAASMGALRAAELHQAGMVGVGRIFSWYRDGIIDADDEVAVVHADAEAGYAQRTRAVVDLRASLKRAVDAGEISPDMESRVLDVVRSMPFIERDDDAIRQRLRRDSVQAADNLQAYDRAVGDFWVDVKAQDARRLLDGIAQGTLPPATVTLAGHEAESDVPRISIYPDWRPSERVVNAEDGTPVTGWQALAAARILALDFPVFLERIALASVWQDARAEGIEVPSGGIAGSATELPLTALLQARGLLGPQAAGDPPLADGDVMLTGTTRELLRRLTDPFLDEQEREHLDDEARLRSFIRRTHVAPWRNPQLYDGLHETGRWGHWVQVAARVNAFNATIRTKRPSFNHFAIPMEQARAWCLSRWLNTTIDGELDPDAWRRALADRGYASEVQWRGDARWVFPFAKLRSDRYDDLDSV